MVQAIRWRLPWWAGVAACAAAGAAAADPIVDRDYAIDFYEGVAIGDTAQVGMGGAGAARVTGSAGALLNSSAPAVRQTTDTDSWSWDYHLDALTGRYSSDYDNNGVAADQASGASLLTGGLALRLGNWSGATTVTGQRTPLGDSGLAAEAARSKLVIARWLPRLDLAIGAGFQTVAFRLSAGGRVLFDVTGGGLVAGATYVPRMERFRVGIAVETAIIGGDVEAADCDPDDCGGYILPREVESPGRLIAGLAYRWAATPWNQLVPRKFRDERSLTVAADIVVAGSSENGHGLEAFGMRELQRSGLAPAVSVRGGAELEWLPGRLRVRAGSYWEPARFEGVDGRLHVTVGADVRLLELWLFGPRRGRISGTADLAARYRNIALSIGFWH
ncbi:MAG TPA: hypothetical protein VK932_15880 [Kofleriaceae bacterium]|nr:hypothetical protein [Kofleriaceae bacterium]